MNSAFCILAAGRGTRLGELTECINKALLPIGNKAVISHIIEKVPADCEIVIAIHYDAEKLKEYCEAAHPDRKFVFVEVDKIEGPGTGPGYSLLCCKEHLQKPFYLCNADTLFTDTSYPDLSCNWIGVAETDTPRKYATVEIDSYHRVSRVIDKSSKGTTHAYIGFMGVLDYEKFWNNLNPGKTEEFQYIKVFSQRYLKSTPVDIVRFDWLDTGSPEGYKNACEVLGSKQILGMPKNIFEITYKVGKRLVKLCGDPEKNRKRLARAEFLGPEIVPDIAYGGKYITCWEWLEGKTLYEVNDLGIWECFVMHCAGVMWNGEGFVEYVPENWKEICRKFYYDKTHERFQAFIDSRPPFRHYKGLINGYECWDMGWLLKCLDWDWICDGIPAKIHGDLQFDNAIDLDNARGYKLIDWRECFGDSPDYGDIYYDLAKLYMGLDLPYNIVKTGDFTFKSYGASADYELRTSSNLESFKISYEWWLNREGYDVLKVKTLSALILLNMSPLHPYPMGDIMYYHANLRLQQLHGDRVEDYIDRINGLGKYKGIPAEEVA